MARVRFAGAVKDGPVNDLTPPAWTMDACHAYLNLDGKLNTPEAVKAYHEAITHQPAPCEPVFTRDMWLIPAKSNRTYYDSLPAETPPEQASAAPVSETGPGVSHTTPARQRAARGRTKSRAAYKQETFI